ncbi:MAG TPA: hypothetical protein DC054_24405 [Blastocatellia bacterium]|nr:hypothetical protein [Blastocatellia bacterium]
MESSFKWRILRKLSTCAFVVMVITQLLGWYHLMQLDDATIDNPIARGAWSQRQHFYDRLGLISLLLFLALRIAYWILEYTHKRRLVASNKGEGWKNK